MSETFTFACVNCGAELEVPVEYCGQQAECTECGEAVVLPSIEEVQAAANEQNPQVIPAEEASEAAPEEENAMSETGTVKIDRASIGMIPDVADQFKLDFESTDSNQKMSVEEEVIPEVEEEEEEPEMVLPAKPMKKWWQFWK